jgi:hypothetical protein
MVMMGVMQSIELFGVWVESPRITSFFLCYIPNLLTFAYVWIRNGFCIDGRNGIVRSNFLYGFLAS